MASEETGTAPSRGLITMAFGHQRYLDMAKSLARSLELHAPHIPRAVLTDSADEELKALFTHVIPYQAEFGLCVGPKFYMDRYSPFDETLFVDSDCLALTNLDVFWEAFAGQYFGVGGWRVLVRGDQDPYIDVDYVLDQFGVEGLPKFNGGTYYFRRCDETTRFFDTARDLQSRASSLHVGNFRDGGAPDEPIFSLAMAIHGLKHTSMGEGGMWTPIQSTGPIKLDAIRGTCSFVKEGRKVSPDIIHFAGEYAKCFAYPRECARLKRHFDGGPYLTVALAKAFTEYLPWQISRSSRSFAKKMLKQNAVIWVRNFASR